jgi:hypothetical protein
VYAERSYPLQLGFVEAINSPDYSSFRKDIVSATDFCAPNQNPGSIQSIIASVNQLINGTLGLTSPASLTFIVER